GRLRDLRARPRDGHGCLRGGDDAAGVPRRRRARPARRGCAGTALSRPHRRGDPRPPARAPQLRARRRRRVRRRGRARARHLSGERPGGPAAVAGAGAAAAGPPHPPHLAPGRSALMATRLFGTDGVRGIANAEPMTSETALRLGRAVAHVSKRSPHRHKILIGKDTRLSGYMLETAMASGICSMGVDVLLVGPLPTPGIAFLTRSLRADAGAVISASHNPFQDNGIKFFAATGLKLPDDVELEIERLLSDNSIAQLRPTATEIGKAYRVDDAVGRYNVFVKNTFPRHLTLDGLRVAVDCANGSAYRVAPEVLSELGASVTARAVDPDGENINRDCGALHPEALARSVVEQGCHMGLALDGDADRAIFVDEKGEVVDGDEVLTMAAAEMLRRGKLAN